MRRASNAILGAHGIWRSIDSVNLNRGAETTPSHDLTDKRAWLDEESLKETALASSVGRQNAVGTEWLRISQARLDPLAIAGTDPVTLGVRQGRR